jgi:hypothetical protein
MTRPNLFQLIPFGKSIEDLPYRVEGAVERTLEHLLIQFRLVGNLQKIEIPSIEASIQKNPKRKDGLWKATCFESFLSFSDQKNYWELNFAPNGDWNCYSFTSYRQGMTEVQTLTEMPIRAQLEKNEMLLEVKIDLKQMLGQVPEKVIEMAVTAVIEKKESSSLEYWALSHLEKVPDFHLRKSFLLRI